MKKMYEIEYVTVADLMEILAKVENPTETIIGVPCRNGYGEKYYAPTTELEINPNERRNYLFTIYETIEILPLDCK